jgi:hypothetical protein
LWGANKCTEFIARWNEEAKSTVYWVRFFCYSVVKVTPDPVVLTIKRWDDVWARCEKTITFVTQPRRVVMGMGPSGCGKSTIAKAVFPWFKLKTVVFIDGGISRETSLVWNMATIYNQSNGIADLYTFFKKNSSKDELFEMLKQAACSFYVPDTLVASANISKYTALDPNWVGLIIWQHLNKSMWTSSCDFNAAYKCVGCDVSGYAREMIEGKKYDSMGYSLSMANSMQAMSGSKYKFFIHNSGAKERKSVVAYEAPETYKSDLFVMVPMRLDASLTKIKQRMKAVKGGKSLRAPSCDRGRRLSERGRRPCRHTCKSRRAHTWRRGTRGRSL